VVKILQQLNIRPSEKVLFDKNANKTLSHEEELVDMLDTLFMQVCDITDMRMYSFKVDIKICRDYDELNALYEQFFKSDLHFKRSFYFYDPNSIYVAQEGVQRDIMGHEIAHAIISHYFVVPPPVKIQEVLAMYVEYNLRHTAEAILCKEEPKK
jgi:hypothetical protein